MQPVRLEQIIKELAVVRAELEGHRVQGAARLELLRRQATLGDRRTPRSTPSGAVGSAPLTSARDDGRLAELQMEADHARRRLDLYRARAYGLRP
jgi:hypothetical protein